MNGRSLETLDLVQALAVVLVALALVPAGAHLFELPGKMTLATDQYMAAQRIYTGWALFGIVILGALSAVAGHTYLVRTERKASRLSLAALLCLAATQAIFWTWTYPMNVATANWTVTPEHFEAARAQWEYSHAVNAVLTFAALVLIVAAVIASRPAPR